VPLPHIEQLVSCAVHFSLYLLLLCALQKKKNFAEVYKYLNKLFKKMLHTYPLISQLLKLQLKTFFTLYFQLTLSQLDPDLHTE
jgi:hypothetical protein